MLDSKADASIHLLYKQLQEMSPCMVLVPSMAMPPVQDGFDSQKLRKNMICISLSCSHGRILLCRQQLNIFMGFLKHRKHHCNTA